jgi:hypothetical protein
MIKFLKKLLPKNWKPIFIEDSKIPVWLSKIAPLNIGAICLFIVVFSRGKMDETTRRHETIHFQQCLDTLVIGTLLLYAWDWIHGLIKYRNNWNTGLSPRRRAYTSAANKAYYRVRSEQEAYSSEHDDDYLKNRKRLRWILKYGV